MNAQLKARRVALIYMPKRCYQINITQFVKGFDNLLIAFNIHSFLTIMIALSSGLRVMYGYKLKRLLSSLVLPIPV